MLEGDTIAWYCFREQLHTLHLVTETTFNGQLEQAACLHCGVVRDWDGMVTDAQ